MRGICQLFCTWSLFKESRSTDIHLFFRQDYPLSLADATAEARQLIDKGQLWVGTLMGEVASICAVTRSSLNVSAITKVP